MSIALALDQGGRSSRAIAFDRRGEIVATGSCRIGEQRVGADRVEQDPEELVASLKDAIVQCGARDFSAAGLATQRSSLVCWDRSTGEALSPVISWQDRRAAGWLDAQGLDRADIRARTGLFVSPHYGASKMRWCLDHLPRVSRARDERRLVIGPLASFLVFRLLDERPLLVDPANASRTLLWNVSERDWDPRLCELFGVPADVLPRCVPTRHAFGTIGSIPFEVLNGDQSAAAFAEGIPRTDRVYVNMGTGAFVQRPVGEPSPDLPRLLESVILRDASRELRVIEGTINGAGSAIDEIAAELGLVDAGAHLDSHLQSSTAPPLFLNGVSGLAAPFWSPRFRSRFVGDGSPSERITAVAESIVFLVRTILDEMATKLPPPERICVSGGLARADGVCQRIADLCGAAVERSAVHEATARGLARLLFGEFEDERRPPSDEFAPRDNAPLCERFERWTGELHAALAHDRH